MGRRHGRTRTGTVVGAERPRVYPLPPGTEGKEKSHTHTHTNTRGCTSGGKVATVVLTWDGNNCVLTVQHDYDDHTHTRTSDH